MWIFLGLAAIGATFAGGFCVARGKPGMIWAFCGIALTALTLCAEYQMLVKWAESNDWSTILDVAPTMNTALWVLTGISIAMNIGTVVIDQKIRQLES